MEKKKSSVGELMKFAGNHRFFVYASWVLSGVSAVLAMAPFYFIWRLIREVLAVRPDFASAALSQVLRLGSGCFGFGRAFGLCGRFDVLAQGGVQDSDESSD